MRSDIIDAVHLGPDEYVMLSELIELSGLSERELYELVDCGALVPCNPESTPWTFRIEYVVAAKSARRLRDDFELDTAGLALVLTLLQQINALEAEMRDLHARLPGWWREI